MPPILQMCKRARLPGDNVAWLLQDRLTGRLAGLYEEGKGLRDTLRLALVAVGRGGQGDVGQRIRDEILTVQSNNGAKVSPNPRVIIQKSRKARKTCKGFFFGSSCLQDLVEPLMKGIVSCDKQSGDALRQSCRI